MGSVCSSCTETKEQPVVIIDDQSDDRHGNNKNILLAKQRLVDEIITSTVKIKNNSHDNNNNCDSAAIEFSNNCCKVHCDEEGDVENAESRTSTKNQKGDKNNIINNNNKNPLQIMSPHEASSRPTTPAEDEKNTKNQSGPSKQDDECTHANDTNNLNHQPVQFETPHIRQPYVFIHHNNNSDFTSPNTAMVENENNNNNSCNSFTFTSADGNGALKINQSNNKDNILFQSNHSKLPLFVTGAQNARPPLVSSNASVSSNNTNSNAVNDWRKFVTPTSARLQRTTAPNSNQASVASSPLLATNNNNNNNSIPNPFLQKTAPQPQYSGGSGGGPKSVHLCPIHEHMFEQQNSVVMMKNVRSTHNYSNNMVKQTEQKQQSDDFFFPPIIPNNNNKNHNNAGANNECDQLISNNDNTATAVYPPRTETNSLDTLSNSACTDTATANSNDDSNVNIHDVLLHKYGDGHSPSASHKIATSKSSANMHILCKNFERKNTKFYVEAAQNDAVDQDPSNGDGTKAPENFDFDFVVIGGGPAGLACGGTALFMNPHLAPRFALCDFTRPADTSVGTKWNGLGGTCINTGSFPKKMFHHAGRIGEKLKKRKELGWNLVHHYHEEKDENNNNNNNEPSCDWNRCRQNINDHLRSVSYTYRAGLRSSKVKYINSLAKLIDRWTFEVDDPKLNESAKHHLQKQSSPSIETTSVTNDNNNNNNNNNNSNNNNYYNNKIRYTARRIVIASGCRPRLPTEDECPGARRHGITSDDLFWLTRDPKKTLIVGGGAVALECASVLNSLGRSVTILMRSSSENIIKSADRECSSRILGMMKKQGIEFIDHSVVTSLSRKKRGEKRRDKKNNNDDSNNSNDCQSEEDLLAPIQVNYTTNLFGLGGAATSQHKLEFDTVLFAIGRGPETDFLNLEGVGIQTDPISGKIITDKWNRTSVSNIYSVGDVAISATEAMRNCNNNHHHLLQTTEANHDDDNLQEQQEMRCGKITNKKHVDIVIQAGEENYTEPPSVSTVGVKMGSLLAKRLFKAPKPVTSATTQLVQEEQQVAGIVADDETDRNNNNNENKFSYFHKRLDTTNIPTCIFLCPFEFATVGLSEEEAKSRKLEYKVEIINDFNSNHHSSSNNIETPTTATIKTFMKLVLEKSKPVDGSGEKVLGVHILAPHAAETIQGIAVGMKAGLTRRALEDVLLF